MGRGYPRIKIFQIYIRICQNLKLNHSLRAKKWKSKKLGKNEYWTPTLLGDKKIETMDMETGFIEEEFQDGEEGDLSMESDS